MGEPELHGPGEAPTARPVAALRPDSVRDFNLSLLARAIVTAEEPMSRTDLAQRTGLNRSTTTRLVDRLISCGIVVERGARIVGPGRPSVPLHPAAHTHVAIGVEISDHVLELCVLDLTGAIIAERFQQLPEAGASAPQALALAAQAISRLATQVQDAGLHCIGTACGIPGLIQTDTAQLRLAPNLGWKDVPLPAYMREVPGPDVVFENSSTLAAFAEQLARERSGHPLNDFIYVTGSTGIGAALVRGGRIETGAHGWGAELGHVPIADGSERCSCGATGCLQTFAGRPAILRNAGLTADAPLANLLAALRRHDPTALAAIRTAGHALGIALAAYLNLADLPAVVLGGTLAQIIDDLRPSLDQELDDRVLYQRWAPVQVKRALVTDHVAASGGAWKILLRYLSDPAAWQPVDRDALDYYALTDTPEVTL